MTYQPNTKIEFRQDYAVKPAFYNQRRTNQKASREADFLSGASGRRLEPPVLIDI
jgi:hypothetical protein